MGAMTRCLLCGTRFQGLQSEHIWTRTLTESRLSTLAAITTTWSHSEMMSHRRSHCGTGPMRRRMDLLFPSNSSILRSFKINTGLNSTPATLKRSHQTVRKECCFCPGNLAYPLSNTTHLELKRKTLVEKKSTKQPSLRQFSSLAKIWPLLEQARVTFWYGTAHLSLRPSENRMRKD